MVINPWTSSTRQEYFSPKTPHLLNPQETFINHPPVFRLMEEQELAAEPPNRLKRFIKETALVLHITKKPSREEYFSIVKVTSLGAAIIGAIGFILHILKQLLFR